MFGRSALASASAAAILLAATGGKVQVGSLRPRPALALVTVLGWPNQLVEIEAVAV